MSFYTSLTGLNAAATQLGVTSNNIANVGTTGFKRSRADFGDIFASSPLQRQGSVMGQGVALQGITQEFSQGYIQFSASSLDLAITGDGFFKLRSADGLQDLYTRNGTFILNDEFAVVNPAGQSLMAAAVDSSGKADLSNIRKLIVPRATTGDARETTRVEMALNLPADAQVISAPFDPRDSGTYNLTTAVTVFDRGGNEFLANVYYVKTQRATATDPTSKWQTYVYVGDQRLDERLVQASDAAGERLFVNKYGQVKSEAEIPPQLIARGVTRLYNLDGLRDRQASVPAAYVGETLAQADVVKLKSGTYSVAEALGTTDGPKGIRFRLNVDNSPSDVQVDLSDLYKTDASPVSGVELARILETRINKAYGDQRNFNLASLRDGTVDTKANLFRVRLGTIEKDISITMGTGDSLTSLSTDRLQTLINDALKDTTNGFGTTGTPPTARLTATYSPSQQTFLFTANPSESVALRAFSNTTTNELFGLSGSFSSVDAETASYGGRVIPNGDMLRSTNPNYSQSDQRYGIRVRFDDITGSFSILSGTTGDQSSVRITAPPATDAAATDAFGNFKKIFKLREGGQPVQSLPTRGVASNPAQVTGTTIGVNLDNRFRLTAETNKFTVTVDNVTGLIEMPIGQDFTKESFRELLEQRINSLEDADGRTVNGVKVGFVTQGTANVLRFTSGTQGDDAFLRVTGPSFWGLNDLASARGTTERWIAPPQARNEQGVALYVDRDGNETVEPGDFSEDATRDLWSAVYLDVGELTFDSRGDLASPRTPIALRPASMVNTGSTLEFSINFEGSTQYSSGFAVLAQSQNGRPEGDLMGLDIADDGLISANYSNGTQRNLGKVVLANFTSPTGLRQLGDSSYLATTQAGGVSVGEAGTAGFGTIRAGARERANVDLTQELIELITSQRNFQANAKAIETNNTLTQTIINLRS